MECCVDFCIENFTEKETRASLTSEVLIIMLDFVIYLLDYLCAECGSCWECNGASQGLSDTTSI